MSYESMTIAQLRKIAAEKHVALGKSWKKAQIIAALEEADGGVQAVEAEVIEEDPQGLAVSLLPGTLHADFAALDTRIDGILADYEGWEPTADSEEDLRQIARERKYLNSLSRELDEKRKDIKRDYLRPLTELEGMFNARRDRIKKVADRLSAVEKRADESRRIAKENELKDHYEAMAGLLAEVVDYGQIADPKWLNKSVNIEAAKRELEERCRKAASDWETLKGLNLEFADEAELRFFQTLDLGDATSYAAKLAEDKKRLEAMKAERETYYPTPADPAPAETAPAEPCAPEPVPAQTEPAMQPQPAMQPEPQPIEEMFECANGRAAIVRRLVKALEPYDAWQVQKLAEALENAKRAPRNPPQPRVMVMDAATVEQLQSIGKICGLIGVTGVMKSGTLQQVYERSMQEGAVM